MAEGQQMGPRITKALNSFLIACFAIGLFLPMLIRFSAIADGASPMAAWSLGSAHRCRPGAFQYYSSALAAYVLFAVCHFLSHGGLRLAKAIKALGYISATALAIAAIAATIYTRLSGVAAGQLPIATTRPMLYLEGLTTSLNGLLLLFATLAFFRLRGKSQTTIVVLFCLALFSAANCYGIFPLIYGSNLKRLMDTESLTGAMVFLRSFSVLSMALAINPGKPKDGTAGQGQAS